MDERNAGVFLAWKVFQIRPGQRHAVIEVGISRRGQMRKYARFLKPDIVVVMSIGSEHNRSLGALEETRNEKAEMIRALPVSGLAVLNGDDPQVRLMARETGARVTTFGLDPGCDVTASDVVLDWPAGTRFTLIVKGQARAAGTRLIGRHLVYAPLAAAATSAEEGIPLDDIVGRLAAVPPAPRRMQPDALENGAVILRDEFKSTVESVDAAFAALAEIKAGRRFAVLGDISQPHGSPYPCYRRLGRLCAETCERVVFVGWSGKFKPLARSVRAGGGPPGLLVFAKRDVLAAADILRSELRAGDVVLLKGRASQKLERVALALQGRRVRCRRPECRFKLQDCGRCPSL
jgi:UDP-N-acetylmuramoyl-tripeptide--D-alanyl-D-alanine ligase